VWRRGLRIFSWDNPSKLLHKHFSLGLRLGSGSLARTFRSKLLVINGFPIGTPGVLPRPTTLSLLGKGRRLRWLTAVLVFMFMLILTAMLVRLGRKAMAESIAMGL